MKKILLTLLLTIFVISNAKSDAWHYHNWYFGGQAMITFISESGEPQKKYFSAMTSKEGCASISDYEGNIMFYTNGQTVYNRKNVQMENGDNLAGHVSAPQSSFAVPFPGDDGRYYLFTMAADENQSNGLKYSIVDMIDNQGDGKVLEKNIPIRTNVSEAMTVTLYNDGDNLCNGQGYWVICVPNATGEIHAFRADSNKINNAVVSSANTQVRAVQIKISNDRTKAAITYSNFGVDGFVSLYDFNNVTGRFSFIKSYPVKTAYGVEFSPNDELLYVTNYSDGEIHQFDLITDGEHIFTASGINQIHSLQLGPDGRIYASLAGQKWLGRINQPNTKGASANFVSQAVNLDPWACQWGLPQSIPNIPECSNKSFFKIYILENNLCEGSPLLLYARKYQDGQYDWTAPNGDKYTGSIVSTTALRQYSGIWTLKVTFPDGQVYNLSTEVVVVPGPQFTITGDTTLCGEGDKVTIRAKASTKLDTLYWNTVHANIDSSNSVIYPTQPGRYVVYGRNKAGCFDSAEVNIVKFDPVYPEIQGDTIICHHDETELNGYPRGATGEYEYEWSTGETTQMITVADSGSYWLRVYQVGGCADTAWFNLTYYEPYIPEYNIVSPVTICEGEVLQITLLNGIQGYYYEWEDGSQLTNRKVTEAGNYILKTRTNEGCEFYDTLTVFVRPSPVAEILQGDDIVSCSDSPIELEAREVDSDYYTWSTGETTRIITVSTTGNYWVAVGFANSPCIDTAFINVTFDDNLDVTVNGETKICGEGSVVLSTNYNGSVFNYEWSTGETTSEITVSESGTYSVRVYTASGCEDTGDIIVEKFEQPIAELNYSSIVEICEGESIELIPQNINNDFNNYWTDGFNGLNRTITSSGTYIFVVENDICIDTARVEVIVNPVPEANITSSGTSLCLTPEIDLTVEPFNTENTYLWSTGETGETITINTPGEYTVDVTTPKGCVNSASITINEAGDIEFYIIPGSNIELCEGETVDLEVSEDFASYLWSTGETTKKITVDAAGEYTVTVYDETGCSASKSANVILNFVELALDKNTIEFSEVCIGETTNQTLQISNINENDIRIEKYEYSLSSSFGDVINGSMNTSFILTPSESYEIDLSISPDIPANWTGKIVIYVSAPCEAIYEAELSARSIHRTTFDLPELKLDAGTENIQISMTIDQNCEINTNFASDYRAVVKFDAYYYNLQNTLEGIQPNINFEDGYVFAEIVGTYNFTGNNQNKIFTMIGQALVGREEETPLTLEEFEWINPNIYFEETPGTLFINPFCQQDLFQITYFEPTQISISPNPAENIISAKINSEEVGHFSLLIVNSIGTTVKRIEFNNNSKINDTIELSLEDLSSGIYNVILSAPWTHHSEQLIIIK